MALPDLTDQFIADSYEGILHTSNQPIVNFQLPPVYDGLGNKSALRIGQDGYGVSINGSLSANNIALPGYNTIVDYLFPIGSVYMSANSVNPQSRFTGTIWQRIAEGRFVVGVGGDTVKGINRTYFAGEDSAGEYRHELVIAEMPSHTHQIRNGEGGNQTNKLVRDTNGVSAMNSSSEYGYFSDEIPVIGRTGGGVAHENSPPAFGLYIWQRIG